MYTPTYPQVRNEDRTGEERSRVEHHDATRTSSQRIVQVRYSAVDPTPPHPDPR